MYYLLKVGSPVLFVITFLFCISLSGCTSTIGAWPSGRESIVPPTAAPKIIYGQNAYVYGYSFDVDVWKATGLFSSVKGTSSLEPPMKGVLIVRKCRADTREVVFPSGLLYILTVGLIPAVQMSQSFCDLEFYQNGTMLGSTLFSYHEKHFTGWSAVAYKNEDIWKQEAQMCANRLLNVISKQ